MNNEPQDFNALMSEYENELAEKARAEMERERAEIERTRNRRQRVLELLRANARGQLRDSMEMFRAHPLRVARRLPDGGVL